MTITNTSNNLIKGLTGLWNVAMKNDVRVNEDLTHEQLKKYKGFENINEAEAEKQIEFIKRMAKVMYYMYVDEQKQNKRDNENRP